MWCGNSYYDLITEKTIPGCNYIFFTNCSELLNVLVAVHKWMDSIIYLNYPIEESLVSCKPQYCTVKDRIAKITLFEYVCNKLHENVDLHA